MTQQQRQQSAVSPLRRLIEGLLILTQLGIAGFLIWALLQGPPPRFPRDPLSSGGVQDLCVLIAGVVVPLGLGGSALSVLLGRRRWAALCQQFLAFLCLLEVVLLLYYYFPYKKIDDFLMVTVGVGLVLAFVNLYLARWLRQQEGES